MDRLALLRDFGVAVRVTLSTGAVDLVGIVRGPTSNLDGVGSEVEFIESTESVLLRSEDVPGVRVEDPVQVLAGPYAGDYLVIRHLQEEDGAFTRLDLGK